jgi:hypothetical protein
VAIGWSTRVIEAAWASIMLTSRRLAVAGDGTSRRASTASSRLRSHGQPASHPVVGAGKATRGRW